MFEDLLPQRRLQLSYVCGGTTAALKMYSGTGRDLSLLRFGSACFGLFTSCRTTLCSFIPKYTKITFKPAFTVLFQVSLPLGLIEMTKFWMDLGGDKQQERKPKTSLGMTALSVWLLTHALLDDATGRLS